ncbi:protein SOB FIVE-LIKE 5-like [Rhodamnia argentea]|uniref:Protein SOB FIVE-LIKE 5-like n=1 Tax=Rhodamnia argentea TaxID=178133 RepID=A0A8B8P104_9MYRT|nr:protein SOB FIVE-LIKE 5-like [Rhodamnia argentea]
MNSSTSQSSGDCESGWTLALEQWQGEVHKNYTYTRSGRAKSEEGGEEDLSMVSDASSGPPFHEAKEDLCNENERSSSGPGPQKLGVGGGKKKKAAKGKEHRREEERQHLCYKDTATSIPISFTKKKYSPTDNDAAKAKGKSELGK